MREEIAKIRENIKSFILENKENNEHLVILSVGDNPASEIYMRNKVKLGDELGIKTTHIICKDEWELRDKIAVCNMNQSVTGIIVQLPIPNVKNEQTIIDYIDECKDVDLLTTKNRAKMFLGKTELLPATANGVVQIINSKFKTLEGLDIVPIGRSELCNMPLVNYLTRKNSTVTLCHSKTKDLFLKTRNADVIVSAVGKMDFIEPHFIGEKTKLVIDVGINRNSEGKIQGDVSKDVHNMVDCTPWVGGLGSLTVSNLFLNVVLMNKLRA